MKRIFLLIFALGLIFSLFFYFKGSHLFVNAANISLTVKEAVVSAPVLTSINPSSRAVGSSEFVMTLTGSNFIPSSVVRFAGSDRATTFDSANQLRADILTTDLQTAGSYNITVFNDDSGLEPSPPVVFIVTGGGGPGPSNPVPILNSINPTSKTKGDSEFTMTLTGSNFISSSVVRFAGSARTTTFVSSNTLQAKIPSADLLVDGDFDITVFNPSPGGGESAVKIFTVNLPEENPVPKLTSIEPLSKPINSQTFTMTLTGSDFVSSSVVRFAGSARTTTFVNSNTLQAQIPSADLLVVGDFNITVFNPTPGGGESKARVFKINLPKPELNKIEPTWKYINSSGFTMTLTGSDFISSSVVRFAGSARTTTFVSSTELKVQILSTDLQTLGDFNITVFNPTPGGGESEAKVFKVIKEDENPVPTLTTINPSSRTVNSPSLTMTLTGSDFISSSVVRFAGSARTTTFVSSTELKVQILSTDLQTLGDFNITVFSPIPGGGESEAKVFKVIKEDENPVPVLLKIDPFSRVIDSSGFTMTLTGSDFIESSVVRFAGSDRTTTFVNSNTLQAQIPSTDLLVVGDFNITVFSPIPGGGESGAKVFTVREKEPENPRPILSSIDPFWQYQNSSGLTMTLTGSDFISSSVVRFAGSARTTTFVSSNTLQAQIPSADLLVVGDFNITVSSPGPGGGLSDPRIFRVLLPEEDPPPEPEPEPEPELGPTPEILPPVITEPLDGTFTNQPIIIVKGTAQADQIVELFINDQKKQEVRSDQGGEWQVSFELEEGEYFLFALSQEKKSNIVKLVVDLTPPEPPILKEIKVLRQTFLLTTTKIALSVKGESSTDSELIRLVINPEFVFSPAAEKWERVFDITLRPGQYQIYAFAYDLAGNISLPSNVLEFRVEREILPPLMIAPLVEETVRTITKIIDDPVVEKRVEETSRVALPAATAVSVGAAASVVVTSGFSFFQLLPMLYLIFIQPFVLLFRKKGRRGWGVVYNSLTKQPVDLAPVRLFDLKTNRLISTKISDRAGRYFFTVNPGLYRIVVNKAEYVFPSKYLAGFEEDFRYLNLYQGQEIEVKEKNTIINANIPIDPNKEIKSDQWLIRDHVSFSLKKAIPIAVLIMSLLSYIVNPSVYLLGLVIFNFLLLVLINTIKPKTKKDWGIVADKKNKKPLSRAVVRIFDSTFNKLIDQQVTNTRGQYGFLVGGRKFYLTYNKVGYQEKESPVLDFQKEEKGKVVNLNAYLEKQKQEQNKNQEQKLPDSEQSNP